MRGRHRRWAVALSAVVALAIAAPAVASAAPSHHRGTTTTTSAAVKAYWAAVATIDHQFVAAVNKAKATLNAELAAARTAGQRSTAHAQYTLAIVEATQARDAALVALGPAPATGTGARVVARAASRVAV